MVDENGTLPPGIVVYYYGGSVPIEGQARDVRRAYRTFSGRLYVERLDENLDAAGWLYTLAIDAPTGRVAVGMCVQGYCGGYGSAQPGAENLLYLSDDGGITWRAAGSLPFNATLQGFAENGPIVFSPGEGTQRFGRWWVFPEGQDLPRPAGGERLVASPQGDLLWTSSEGDFIDASGSVVWRRFDGAAFGLDRGRWQYTRAGFATAFTGGRAGASRKWFLEISRAGDLVRAFWSDEFSVNVLGELHAGVFLIDSSHVTPTTIGRAGVIDLEGRAVTEWADLKGPGDREAFARAGVMDHFAVIVNTGDCLNVRAGAGLASQSLGCFADGVLLKDLGQTADAGGLRWLNVQTPAGAPGWASMEYVDR